MKKIAVANDISSFGKCSLSAALPIISSLNVQCCPLVTGVFSNQTDFPDYCFCDLTDFMAQCIKQWKKMNFTFDAILTGYISSAKQGDILSKFIDDFSYKKLLVCVDPVMGDDGEIYKGFEKDRIDAVKKLVSKAHIITPNLTELCILSSEDYKKTVSLSKEELLLKVNKMSEKLQTKTLKTIITTGIHTDKDEITNCVYSLGKFDTVCVKAQGGRFSGTGDIFCAIVTAEAVKGKNIKQSVKKAADFIYKAIYETQKNENENYDKNNGVNFESLLYLLSEDT